MSKNPILITTLLAATLVGCARHDTGGVIAAPTTDVTIARPRATASVASASAPLPSAPPDLSGNVCAVHWSADGAKVAGVGEHAVDVVDAAESAHRVLGAPAGATVLDYSMTDDTMLVQRGPNRRALRLASGEELALDPRWPDPLVMAQDGRAIFHGFGDDMKGAIDDHEFYDIGARKVVELTPPHFSAGGSEQTAIRVRRGAVIVAQSRILLGIYAFRENDPTDSHPGFAVSNCFAMDAERGAQFFSADVDATFTTTLVGEVDCQRKAPRVPVVEVFERGASASAAPRILAVDGKPIAIDLSASGNRAIITVEKPHGTTEELWDVRSGKRLGNVDVDGSCFEISPNGASVGAIVHGALQVRPLP